MEDIYSHKKKNQTQLKTYMRNSELMTSRKHLDLEVFRKPRTAKQVIHTSPFSIIKLLTTVTM